MKIVYDILRIFQKEMVHYCDQMKNCEHQFDKDNLNIYHLESNLFAHTMMVYNSFIQKLKNDYEYFHSLEYQDKINIAVMLLCHDIGKSYTRSVPKGKFGKISFYGHGFASVQPCFEFVSVLRKKYNIDIPPSNMYKILCVIANHIDYYGADDLKRSKMYGNDIKLYTLFETMLFFDEMGSITETGVYRKSDFNPYIRQEKDTTLPTVTMYCGVPGCGKDYIAGIYFKTDQILSYDNIRIEEYLKSVSKVPEFFTKTDVEIYDEAFKYCIENNINVEQMLINKVRELIKEGKDVVICNTGVRRKARRYVISQLKNVNIDVKYIMSDMKVIYIRDNERSSKNLGKEVINSFMFDQQIPTYEEGMDDIEFIYN